jgi:hypothetical protein
MRGKRTHIISVRRSRNTEIEVYGAPDSDEKFTPGEDVSRDVAWT